MPHKSRWDRKKCKRNKGQLHDMVLVKDQLKTGYDWDSHLVPGWRVYNRRPIQWVEREWRCSFCNKKETYDGCFQDRVAMGDWEEYRRVEDKRQPK